MITIKLHKWLLDGLKLDGNSWPQRFILVEMYWKHLVEPCIHYHWLNVFVGLCNLYLLAFAIYICSDVLALYCWIIVYHKSQPCILSWSLPNTDFKCICCTWQFIFVDLGNLYLYLLALEIYICWDVLEVCIHYYWLNVFVGLGNASLAANAFERPEDGRRNLCRLIWIGQFSPKIQKRKVVNTTFANWSHVAKTKQVPYDKA